YCDAAGHLWFSAFSSDYRLFKRSVERAAHGATRLTFGGKILLLDSAGRYWCKSDGSFDLLCFDGKQWLAPHAPPGPSSPQAPHSMIQPVAVEDPSGNCYFLAAQERATPMLMCFTSAGVWKDIPFPPGTMLTGEERLSLQSQGRVAVYSREKIPQGKGTSMLMAQALMAFQSKTNLIPDTGPSTCFVYDGQALVAATPTEKSGRRINQLLPLPDGSILLIYQGSSEAEL
ncbi:MAG: hypothetical protein ACTHLZ_06895, partial [Tepidisphaeraceae bacterium]